MITSATPRLERRQAKWVVRANAREIERRKLSDPSRFFVAASQHAL